jgi:PKD repeat protein
MLNNKVIILLFMMFLLPAVVWAGVGPNYIEQWGITWTFDKNISTDGAYGTYQYGQFVNGDYWVKGPVEIIAIDPPSADISGRTMNGSMINPSPTSTTQGYDSAMAFNIYDSNDNKALNLPRTLEAGSSLVSTISVAGAGARPQLQTAAVLTVLSSAPPAGSFRPAYSGIDKTIKYNKNQLNYSVLKSLTPVANMPTLHKDVLTNPSDQAETVERWFQRPWIDHIGGWAGGYQHPVGNMPNYGQFMSNQIGDAALMLNLNFTPAQKEKLLIGLVQAGIDFYGIAQAGGIWQNDGGHCMGRLLPIQIAGLMLGDSNMLNVASFTNPNVVESIYHNPQMPKVIFQELQNTFYVGALDVSITQDNTPIAWNPDSRDRIDGLVASYTQDDVINKLPEYGVRHMDYPEKDNRNWEATGTYRSINGAASTSHALAAVIMGLKPYWNHDVFFEYIDRWYYNTQPHGYQAYQDIGNFCRNMWDTYRADYGPIWPEKAPVQKTNKITQFGITWTFDKEYEYGQFANGDYWVVGPVEIAMINPMSTVVNGVSMNGTMINPKSGDINSNFGSGRHQWQGFDSRLYNYDISYNKGRPNGNDISAGNPMIVGAGSSVISSESDLRDWRWGYVPQLVRVSILTVLDKPAPSGSFRPGYSGDDKSVKFNVNNLDYSKLGSYYLSDRSALTPLTKGTGLHGMDDDFYCRDTLERMVERLWLDFASDTGGSYMHPTCNIGSGRDNSGDASGDGRWRMLNVSEIALTLNSANYTKEQKEKLLIGFVQVGIDDYSVHQGVNIAWDSWVGNGQVNAGHKFPILFAGMLLNDPQMLNIGNSGVEGVGYGNPGYVAFAEDEQTFYVAQRDIDGWSPSGYNTADIFSGYPPYAGHDIWTRRDGQDSTITLVEPQDYYTQADLGIPDWGIRHCSSPRIDTPNFNLTNTRNGYRSTNSTAWGGFVLAAHMMNMKALWNNNAFFDYMDRWMAVTNNNLSPKWVANAWIDHRSSLADPIWPETDGVPTASFTATPTSGNKPLQAYFDASASTDSGGSIVNYAWNFGDSSTATGVTASHTYTNSGSFTCSLIVTDNDGKTATATKTITVTEPVVPGCTLSTTSFQNQSFTNQTGSFTAEFDVTANATGIDGVIGLSANPAASYTDLACIVRFNESGYIDVRNGAGYTSLNTVSYTSGVKYHLKLEVNILSHTYSVYVTPQGLNTVTLGSNYAFRSEQSTVTSLSNIGIIHYYGSFQLCNFTLNAASITYGDISGDSALSAYDAALAARIAVGLDAYPTGDNLTKADVSGDKSVTAYDAALIAQKAVGLITKFPVEG